MPAEKGTPVIDVRDEKLMEMRDVCNLPWLSRPRTVSTIYRWAAIGIPGVDGTRVKLETLQEAGRRVTSEQAVLRFFERLARPADMSAARTQRDETKAVHRASAILEAAGIEAHTPPRM